MAQPVARSLLLGLIGDGTELSRTPAMHEAEGLAQGVPTAYRRIDTLVEPARSASLPALLQAATMLGFDGLNITHPFKQQVLQYLDEVDEQAARIGAVNTVTIRDGKLTGYNTDVTGFARGLAQGLPHADLSHVVLVGAGGAGKAVAHALLGAGVERLAIADLDPKRSRTLADEVNAGTGQQHASGMTLPEAEKLIPKATGVVNATPVGMPQLPGTSFDTSLLRPEHWVSDVIYMPIETQLLADATARGCAVLDGTRMAVGQAVDAFERFTGLPADAARMRATFVALGQ